MLVLSRSITKDPNKAMILLTLPDGREVRLTLTAAGHDWAQIGIEAPSDVIVLRAEVLARIDAGEPIKRRDS